jgi:SAM-dependent methyltransferase
MDAHKRVQWIYSSTNNSQLSDRYNEWAESYESDLDSVFEWVGPERITNVFAGCVAKDSSVIDIGAGTGLLGLLLAENGYKDITAIDLSPGMLAIAGRKNVYRELTVMVLGEPLDYDDNQFDAGISCGVFTVGHAPASAFDELIRIVRPGGLIVFSVQLTAYETAGFKEKFEVLEADGKWKMVEVSPKFQPLPRGEPNVWHRIWTYRVI